MPKKSPSRRKPVRPGPKQRQPEEPQQAPAVEQPKTLRGSLAQNLHDNARLRQDLERQREATEGLAKQLNRLDMDLSKAARTILEAADALERLHAAETDDVEAYRGSIRRTAGELMRGLMRHSGIEIIGAPGETVEPDTHKVLESREHPEAPAGTVLGVAERGLKYHGDVVQTASVIVSSGPSDPAEQAEPQATEPPEDKGASE